MPRDQPPACDKTQHLRERKRRRTPRALVRRGGAAVLCSMGLSTFDRADAGGLVREARWVGRQSRRAVAAFGPCLCIPFADTLGWPTGYVRCKPDNPRLDGGKPVKYESPVGTPNQAFVRPCTRAALAAPSAPLLITEGEKEAAKADQDGFPCVGLVGVWAWQQKRTTEAAGKKTGPRQLTPELAVVAWRGRRVTIAFDSDRADKPDVARAERHLAAKLRAVGADVRCLRLRSGPGGAKVGSDDHLVAHGPDARRTLVAAAEPSEAPPATTADGDAKKPPSAAGHGPG